MDSLAKPEDCNTFAEDDLTCRENITSSFEEEKQQQKCGENRSKSARRVRESRENERIAFIRLEEIVPTLNKTKKVTKAITLQHTCDYINTLKKMLHELTQQKMDLEQELSHGAMKAESLS